MVDVFLNGGSVITKGTVKGARMNTSLVPRHNVIQTNFPVGSMFLINPTAYQSTGNVTM